MNKDELEKLINPSWLKASQRIQEQLKLANSLNHQPIAISNMQKQLEAYNSSIALQQPKWLETAKTIAKQSNRILKGVEQSELMQSFKRFDEISRQASFALKNNDSYSRLLESSKLASNAFQEPQWLASAKAIAEQSNQILKNVEWVKSIKKFDEISRQASLAFKNNDSYSRLLESAKLASNLYGLDALESIANLKNSPLSKYNERLVSDYTETFYPDEIYDLNNDINTEIGENDDFEQLPLSVQSKIFYYLKFTFLTIFLNLISNYIYDQRELLAQSLNMLTQTSEVKSYVRKSQSRYDRDVLSGLRVVAGNNVNLRTQPSMKSDIIVQLDTGTLVEVLDKSNRTWLLIEITDGDEIIQGWISRRYTVYFK